MSLGPQTKAEVAIDIVAHDKASSTTKRTVDSVTRDIQNLKREQRLIRSEFELNNRSLVATGRVLQSVGRAAFTLTSLYTQYNIMQLRISDANRTVRETHDEYLRVLADTGPFSQEAQRALEDYNRALEEQKRAADEVSFAMVGFGLSGLTAVGSLINAIPRLRELAAAIRAVGTASTLGGAAAAGGNVLPGMVGAGKAGGLLSKIGGLKGVGAIGGAGLVAGGLLTGGLVNPEASNTDRLLSLAQTAGGGALFGLSLGGPIGALIGGGAGLAVGLATNYSEEFGNLFAGHGFVSDADRDKAAKVIQQNNFYGYDLEEAERIAGQQAETATVYGE